MVACFSLQLYPQHVVTAEIWTFIKLRRLPMLLDVIKSAHSKITTSEFFFISKSKQGQLRCSVTANPREVNVGERKHNVCR